MARTACGFCESTTSKITNEHVFAEWLTPVIGADSTTRIRHSRAAEGQKRTSWDTDTLTHKVRMACHPCNSGWMSDLEGAVKNIIPPMIRDEKRVTLDVDEQSAIAAWAVKTAMVSEYHSPNGPQYFTQAERRSLMNGRGPRSELGAHVWVGHYSGRNDGILSASTLLTRVPTIVEGFTLAFILRKFFVQIFVERLSARHDIYTRPGPWHEALIEVWPPRGFAVWPPKRTIIESGASALFHRFTAQSRPHRSDRPL